MLKVFKALRATAPLGKRSCSPRSRAYLCYPFLIDCGYVFRPLFSTPLIPHRRARTGLKALNLVEKEGKKLAHFPLTIRSFGGWIFPYFRTHFALLVTKRTTR